MSTTIAGLTGAELCRLLGIGRQELGRLLKEGMPCEGSRRKRRFDRAAVDAWLLAKGYAEVETDSPGAEVPPPAEHSTQKIATTRGEAARELGLGVNGERTISMWATMPGFPGRAGSPGRQDGYYPIDEIRQWREQQTRSTGPGAHTADPELAAARRRIALLELEEREREAKAKLGQTLNVDEVTRFFEQCVTNTKAVFSQIPDRILAMLPEEFDEDLRRRVYADVQRCVEDGFKEIAQLLEGDTDPAEDGEEEAYDRESD